MHQPPDLHALYTVMCLAGGLVVVSAVGIAMSDTDKKKTIKRGPLPVATPKALKPAERCYGTNRRWVELQREWKLAHAPIPVQPAPQPTSADSDVFVHWFENCIEIQETKSPTDVISLEDLDKSYLEYCQGMKATALSNEDFITLLASYSTAQGINFNPDTGDLTYVRLKN